ncbi:MAG TPA: hypothetical protein VJU77_01795 [Chthoniobacterales bacterium]|nr:hypothetical protein [Chthoniobacterales bacterium]
MRKIRAAKPTIAQKYDLGMESEAAERLSARIGTGVTPGWMATRAVSFLGPDAETR